MKRTVLAVLLVGTGFAGLCVAQGEKPQEGRSSQEAPASTGKSGMQPDRQAQITSINELQAGSTIQAELIRPVDAHKNKVGDQVLAKTTEDVKSDAHIVLPKGSRLKGHVTEIKAHSKEQATSVVGIAFDHAVLKNGTELPLKLSIQAVGRGRVAGANTDDETMAYGQAGATVDSGSTPTPGRGGVLGDVRSAAGTVDNTTNRANGVAINTVGAATRAGGSANGAIVGSLSSTSRGVVGIAGLSMSASSITHGSVISSNGSNVHLDSGTAMVLRVDR